MADLNEDTRLEAAGPGRYIADISSAWKVWGPNGGYLSALLLRAVGRETDKALPVSFACQYLRVAEFGRAIVEVETLKEGSRSSAYQARLIQDDRVQVQAQVWTGDPRPGPAHQLTSPPECFVELDGAGARPPVGPMPFWDRLEIRGVRATGGRYSHWYRFDPRPEVDDAYVDGARSLVLIDSMHWPARYFMEAEPPRYAGPSLDLYVRFHRFRPSSEWLFSDAVSVCAENGIVAGEATVWDEDGLLLASGGGQTSMQPVDEAY
ncbi:MAG: thioesterase family protein [Longimicrobiales bacterium]